VSRSGERVHDVDASKDTSGAEILCHTGARFDDAGVPVRELCGAGRADRGEDERGVECDDRSRAGRFTAAAARSMVIGTGSLRGGTGLLGCSSTGGSRIRTGPEYAPRVPPRIRVVIAKPGLDGHDRGAKVIARALRDAGMEVVYTGLHQTPEQIVQTVIQEDADAVGLSILSGAHMTLFTRMLELFEEQGVTDVVVFGGGIIPDPDIPELEQAGVAKIFTPGATMDEVVEWVQTNVGTARSE
jgi:isobutyryl-CoA mutase small subunit